MIVKKFSQETNFSWKFINGDIEDKQIIEKIFKNFSPNIVIHLAAQAGVRYSIENPSIYISSNLLGFNNIIECCRNYSISNFIYASSSSVMVEIS